MDLEKAQLSCVSSEPSSEIASSEPKMELDLSGPKMELDLSGPKMELDSALGLGPESALGHRRRGHS